ncbi:Uncharacterised protein [Streptococcus dysgalactiae subsp. equisimilis]|nr:Uncharacterised protein [Streptococcus dysgalactiae subsp. equisimilis]
MVVKENKKSYSKRDRSVNAKCEQNNIACH